MLFLFDCLSYYDNEHSTEEKTTSVIARKDLKHNLYLKLESAPKKLACQSLWWIYLIGKYLIQTWILTHRTLIFFQLWFSPATTVASNTEWCFCWNKSPGWWCMSIFSWEQYFYLTDFLTICLYILLIEILLKIIIICQQHKIDLRDEEPEQMAKRMFTFLRILKFKPKTESGSLWVILILSPPRSRQYYSYCLPYNSYDVGLENLVLDQLLMMNPLVYIFLYFHLLSAWYCCNIGIGNNMISVIQC